MNQLKKSTIVQNPTMVPVRKALEQVGATVTYDAEARVVTAQREDTVVKIFIGRDTLEVNEAIVEMDTEAIIEGNRTPVCPFDGFMRHWDIRLPGMAAVARFG